MTTNAFLAQYGIAEQSLSPEVKDGINDVLGAATKAGIEQLGKVIQKEAQKRGVETGGTSDPAVQDAAVKAAQAEYDAQQAAKQKKQRTTLLLVAAGVLIVGIVVAVLLTKKRPA